MHIGHKIVILLLVVLGIILPSIRMLTHIYYIFSSFFLVVVLCTCILLLPVPVVVRMTLVTTILVVYRNNVTLTGSMLASGIQQTCMSSVKDRVNDSVLRTRVNEMFTSHFNLITNLGDFPAKPTIVVSNYCQDRMENIACILLPCDMAIMMRRGFTMLQLHKLVKWPLFTEDSGTYETTKKLIAGHVLQGRSIFSYVTTKTLLPPNLFIKIRSGMFRIAQELGVTITPVVFDYIDLPGGQIPYQNYQICVGPTTKVDNIQESMRNTMHFFRDKMTEFMRAKYSCLNVKKNAS